MVALGGTTLGLGDGVTGLGDGEFEAATVDVAGAVTPLPNPLLADEHAASPATRPITPVRNIDFRVIPLGYPYDARATKRGNLRTARHRAYRHRTGWRGHSGGCQPVRPYWPETKHDNQP